jgi:hypothetical protein
MPQLADTPGDTGWRHARIAVCGFALAVGCRSAPGQVANPDFEAEVDRPTVAPNSAPPAVCIDEGHHNFHTLEGRYAPFAEVLRADGYRVTATSGTLSAESLATCDVLVIANALHESNASSWTLPTPSAFTTAEIAAVHAWVEAGGGLFLIADHMPFPGAAQQLAAAFGFELANGFAVREGEPVDADVFTRDNGGLVAHPVTDGATPDARVDQVASFTGQGFRAPEQARPILLLGQGYISLEPHTAWQFDADTPRRDVGWTQGATLELGTGRMAMFGEAAMFTSQVAGDGPPIGLDHPAAIGNTRLLRNLVRWLSEV